MLPSNSQDIPQRTRRISMAKLSSTPQSITFRAPPTSSGGNTPQSSYSHSHSPLGSYMESLQRHLPTETSDDALKLPSGDITRELYPQQAPLLVRSKSLEDRRPSMASSMRMPGGFRRDFQRRKYGWTLEKPGPFTKNFLEFLTIYGHFAGEDLEDEDFLACDFDQGTNGDSEECPLLEEGEQHGHGEKKTSSIKAFFLLLKAFIGTGVLFLPKAFANGGLLFSIGLLLLFSILSFYCYYLLAECTILTGVSSFVDMGDNLYGKVMKYLILISIVVSQLGFVAAYTIFTAENLKAFVFNTMGVNLEIWMLVIFEALFFVPMSFIRNLTKLSLAALLANVFILGGIFTIICYATADLIQNGAQELEMFNSKSWSLFIGVAIFAFEGIGLIIPVQQSMKYPSQFPYVLGAVIGVCVILFIGVGSLGYVTYGSQVQSVVILNLPQNAIPVICIQFFYALAIMLSVPLQLLPAIRIMEAKLFSKRVSGRIDAKTKWIKNGTRSIITIFTCLLAWKGSKNLDLFVSFIGCFACVPLVYMYPPMLHAKVLGKEHKWIRALDWFLVIFGGIAAIYTTYQLFQ